MGQIGEMLAVAAKRGLKVGDALTTGITADIAARKPMGYRDGKQEVIDTNHPVFVFGHLSLYPARLWMLQGLDAGTVTPSPEWMNLFKAGAPCLDDADGTIYPKWPEVLERFRTAHEAAMKALPELPDEVFFRDNPVPASREVFPKVLSAMMFIFGSHTTLHFGQVSAWRRCYGLPSAT